MRARTSVGTVAMALALGGGCNLDASGIGSDDPGPMASTETASETEPDEGTTTAGSSADDTTGDSESSSSGPPACEEPMVWYPDGDGDGFGDPARSTRACEAPEGHVAEAGDCNDAAPEAYPGAPELCDALDNDCDDELDEYAEGTNEDECNGCVPRRVGEVVYSACAGDMEWTEGQDLCRSRGAELTSIADSVENDTIELLLELAEGFDFAWIGYNDLQAEGQWVWSDGTPTGFDNWGPAQPDPVGGEGQDCATIQTTTGLWFDRPCANGGLDTSKSDGVVCRDVIDP